MKDPQAIAQDWASRLGSSTAKIQAGIQSVSVAPGQLAARQKQAFVQNVTASADKWGRNVAAVPLGEWQNAAINKGLPRIASGAQAAQDKFGAFMGKLLPFIGQVKGQLPARGNLDQNINRMTAFVRGMAQFSASK